MKKMMAWMISLVFLLSFVGCFHSNHQQEQFAVYSFNGENEQFEISNGVIVLSTDKEIFDGGDLKVKQEALFLNVSSYSATFYIIINGEKRIILSNAASDQTGSSLHLDGDLGSISGDHAIMAEIEDINHNLYFELSISDSNGKNHVYQIPLTLTEITTDRAKSSVGFS